MRERCNNIPNKKCPVSITPLPQMLIQSFGACSTFSCIIKVCLKHTFSSSLKSAKSFMRNIKSLKSWGPRCDLRKSKSRPSNSVKDMPSCRVISWWSGRRLVGTRIIIFSHIKLWKMSNQYQKQFSQCQGEKKTNIKHQ